MGVVDQTGRGPARRSHNANVTRGRTVAAGVRLVRERTTIVLLRVTSRCKSPGMSDDLSTRYTDAVLRIESMLSSLDDAYTVHGATALRNELDARSPFLEQAGWASARGS